MYLCTTTKFGLSVYQETLERLSVNIRSKNLCRYRTKFNIINIFGLRLRFWIHISSNSLTSRYFKWQWIYKSFHFKVQYHACKMRYSIYNWKSNHNQVVPLYTNKLWTECPPRKRWTECPSILEARIYVDTEPNSILSIFLDLGSVFGLISHQIHQTQDILSVNRFANHFTSKYSIPHAKCVVQSTTENQTPSSLYSF